MTDPNVIPGDSAGRTSTSLLRRAQFGKQAAWERLVSLYSPLVYRWCRRWGLQPDDAENVGQDTFQAVARGLAGFQRDRPDDSFRSWLYRIARNKFHDHLRACTVGLSGTGGSDALKQLQQVPEGADADEQALSEEKTLLYLQAVELIRGEFAETHWQAFLAVVVEGHSPAEVAQTLQMSVNTVYLAKSRILRRVRAEFADVIDGLDS